MIDLHQERRLVGGVVRVDHRVQLEAVGAPAPTPFRIDNSANKNFTAYPVRDGNDLFVTLIHKEFGAQAKDLPVFFRVPGISGRALAMTLKAPGNDPTAKDGITLGGAALGTDGWAGQWTDLGSIENQSVRISAPPASAIIVKFELH